MVCCASVSMAPLLLCNKENEEEVDPDALKTAAQDLVSNI